MESLLVELTKFSDAKLELLSFLADQHHSWLHSAVGEVHTLIEERARKSAKRETQADTEPAAKVRLVYVGWRMVIDARWGWSA